MTKHDQNQKENTLSQILEDNEADKIVINRMFIDNNY
jgi:hypothetical protein